MRVEHLLAEVAVLVVPARGLDAGQVEPLDGDRDALGVREIALSDSPEDRLLVDDVIPDHVQRLVVGAVERRREADSFGRPAYRPQAPHDIDCGVRGGTVSFIVDHHVTRHQLFDAAGPAKRLDRAHRHIGRDHVLRGLDDADEHHRVGFLELVDGLLNEFVTVDDDGHALAALHGTTGDLREDHRLAGSGGQGHGGVLEGVVRPILLNCLDALDLVWPELHSLPSSFQRLTAASAIFFSRSLGIRFAQVDSMY